MHWLSTLRTLDEALLRAAHGTPGWAVSVFVVFTFIGGGWGLVALLPFALHRPTRIPVGFLFAAITATSAVVSALKAVVGRTRPCDALSWCPAIAILSPGGPSFPSGHAAGAFAFAIFVSLHARRFLPLLLAYAAVVAWSRCVLGVHYPSDVVFGAAIGAAIGAVFARVSMRHIQKTTRRAKAVADEGC